MQDETVMGTTEVVRETCGLLIGPHTVFWRENSGSHAFTACKEQMISRNECKPAIPY